jgi:HK97 family phage major capsid protein
MTLVTSNGLSEMKLQLFAQGLEELQTRLREIQERMNEINDQAEGRALNEDEQEEWDSLGDEFDEVKSKIENIQSRNSTLGDVNGFANSSRTEPTRPPVRVTGQRGGGRGGDSEFRNLGEFLYELRFNPDSPELREMTMNQGDEGGILVPEQFSDELLKLEGEDPIVRPRARVIPAGNPPDAKISFPALQQGKKGQYGGVEVNWTAEGETVGDSDAKLTDVSLEPQEVSGSITVSNKLLRNAAAMNAMLTELLRGAMIEAEDDAFIQGDGVGKPLGILNSDGAILVSRNTSSKIVYEDVIKMMSKVYSQSNLMWVASQSAFEDIKDMKDSAGNRVYTGPNLVKGTPASLEGIPLEFTGNLPTIGKKGDLMLVDMRYYWIKDGSGPFIAVSKHVKFMNNKTVIKIVRNTDGQSWVKEPLTLRDGQSKVSPFVVLQ